MYIIMKFTVIVPLILAGSIDAFSTSSTTRRSAAVASSTLYAASQLPMPKRSPTANPTIRDASKSVPVKVVTQRERNMMKDVVIDPDYWLSLNVALLCPLILWYHPCKSYSIYILSVCVCVDTVLFLIVIDNRMNYACPGVMGDRTPNVHY